MNNRDISDCDASGMAALSICESLILAMGDLKIMGENDAVGVISDAANAHRNASGSPKEIARHLEAAAILDRIIAGGNSIRRPVI
jgi:hypothetical protein